MHINRSHISERGVRKRGNYSSSCFLTIRSNYERVLGTSSDCFSVFSIIPGDIPHIVQKWVNPAGHVPRAPAAQAGPRRRRRSGSLEHLIAPCSCLRCYKETGGSSISSQRISPLIPTQLGAAVRTIHEACRKVLEHYVKLEPILNSRGSTGDRARRTVSH
jgi:hypothetical protein